MTSMEARADTPPPVRTVGGRPVSTVLAVVGFDGSEPSLAALEAATELIRGRSGHLEVVYVAHLPAYVSMSPPAIVGIRQGFDEIAGELDDTVRAVLDDREPRWHFQRRDGSVTEALVAAATELRRRHGPDAVVVIVVGASAHLLHRNIAVSIAHHGRFALLVVPTEPTARPIAARTDTSN